MPNIKFQLPDGSTNVYTGIETISVESADEDGVREIFVSTDLIPEQKQADWAQNDPSAVDYIKNRPTGTIEIPTEISFNWNTTDLSATNFNIDILGVTAYKVSNDMLTKEQALAANWTVSSADGSDNITFSENDIVFDTDDMTVLYVESYMNFAFAYTTGEVSVLHPNGATTLTFTVPEVGMYVTWPSSEDLPGLNGTILYSRTESQEVNFVQSDWNQEDATSPDYIKNKPATAAFVPLATADDDGKFLRVVGGVPSWTTVQNAEEVLF